MLTHPEKVRKAIAELGKLGIGRYTAAPPAYRFAWFLGSEISPPHFQTFRGIAMFSGSLFGVLFGLMSCLLADWAFVIVHAVVHGIKQTLPSTVPAGNILLMLPLVIAPLSGALFGLWMAAYSVAGQTIQFAFLGRVSEG
jgi:hypothetical protein